jgi:hypothetical protein
MRRSCELGICRQRTELELPIYRHAETKFLTQFPQVVLGHALDVWLATCRETSMSRNFGVPRQTYGGYRGSMWPLVVVTLIMIGLIDVATHLHHW